MRPGNGGAIWSTYECRILSEAETNSDSTCSQGKSGSFAPSLLGGNQRACLSEEGGAPPRLCYYSLPVPSKSLNRSLAVLFVIDILNFSDRQGVCAQL